MNTIPNELDVEPQPNLPLLRKVIEHVEAHPEEWDQSVWVQVHACGAAYCVAGWALVLSGHTITPTGPSACDAVVDGDEDTLSQWREGREEHPIQVAARQELGIDRATANNLFRDNNTLPDIKHYAEQIALSVGERL